MSWMCICVRESVTCVWNFGEKILWKAAVLKTGEVVYWIVLVKVWALVLESLILWSLLLKS
jgi:hypothetical protein